MESAAVKVGGYGTFDAAAFHAALDRTRRQRGLLWKDVAAQAGVSASTLTRIAQGRRPDVGSLAALVTWAGLSADEFVRRPGQPSEVDTPTRSGDAQIAGGEIEDPGVGSLLAAVRLDLAEMGELSGGARRSKAALALYLAGVLDHRGAEAAPTVTARLAQELRTTLESLEREPDRERGESVAELLRVLSTPGR